MKGIRVHLLKNGLSLPMGVYVAQSSIVWFKHLSSLFRERKGKASKYFYICGEIGAWKVEAGVKSVRVCFGETFP